MRRSAWLGGWIPRRPMRPGYERGERSGRGFGTHRVGHSAGRWRLDPDGPAQTASAVGREADGAPRCRDFRQIHGERGSRGGGVPGGRCGPGCAGERALRGGARPSGRQRCLGRRDGELCSVWRGGGEGGRGRVSDRPVGPPGCGCGRCRCTDSGVRGEIARGAGTGRFGAGARRAAGPPGVAGIRAPC